GSHHHHHHSQDPMKTQPNKTVIKILGLKNSKAASNPDGGLRSLLDFLERKSKEKITLGRGIIDGDYVWLKVNKDDAQHLLRLNGFTYAGATLTIEETNEPMPALSSQSKLSQAAQETKQKL
uniref:mRNA export protein n=1 Tax=Chaetomium thermophilum (strain DSM 1495 / CBS 144.50 / IMI 039719) TaxID=759272 RepID=UPI00065F26F4|nr:Chain A, mRNA export protein [Thermochaetoides thermophila DSM 1495]4WPM_B Chain B, mRNA export protein [Thermochaetoides thermophila DSM 1495]